MSLFLLFFPLHQLLDAPHPPPAALVAQSLNAPLSDQRGRDGVQQVHTEHLLRSGDTGGRDRRTVSGIDIAYLTIFILGDFPHLGLRFV